MSKKEYKIGGKPKGEGWGLSTDMKNIGHDEQRAAALLGTELGRLPIAEDVEMLDGLSYLYASDAQQPIWEWWRRHLLSHCESALTRGDADYFERMARVMRRYPSKGLSDATRPIDYLLLHYKSVMEPRDYSGIRKKADRQRLEKLQKMRISEGGKSLPSWPAPAVALQAYVSAHHKCTISGVTKAADRLGIPWLRDSKGRGRRLQ
jgi:hypothetical protein